MGSHQSEVQGKKNLPWPTGQVSFDAAQDVFGVLSCKHTLPDHVELLVNHHDQVLLSAALNPFSAQPVFVLGIILTYMPDLTLGLVERREVCRGSPFKPT